MEEVIRKSKVSFEVADPEDELQQYYLYNAPYSGKISLALDFEFIGGIGGR